MVELVVKFDPATLSVNVQTAAPPELSALVLAAAAEVARNHALSVLAQRSGAIEVPSARDVRALTNGKAG